MSLFPGAGPQLRWLSDMISFLQGEELVIPTKYREQVLETKALLNGDSSGLASTLLDFAISAAVDVDYNIETNNQSLGVLLNNWLGDINSSLRGKVPTGIESLAKEYFRERWKGSSFLLLRTAWEDVDGYYLPTKMWFVDGEDIEVETKDEETVILGDEKYLLRIKKNKSIPLGVSKDEMLFVQKPFTSWGQLYPVPFLIQRGTFYNLKFLEILNGKGVNVLTKALEYLMLIKKGTERLALEGRSEFVYSDEDLKAVKNALGIAAQNSRSQSGIMSYATNFDTEIEHLIPEYNKILNGELHAPIEKRILGSLGLIDIVQGMSSSRKESLLNPKPFMGEVQSGVNDFSAMIKDIVITIAEQNATRHKKNFSAKNIIEIRTSPIKLFMDNKIKTLLRNMYDRGILSKRTAAELIGDLDYDMERERRTRETNTGDDDLMIAPVIQNNGQIPSVTKTTKISDKDVSPDKTGLESLDFKNANTEFEQAPYSKNSDLPSQVKDNLPSAAQTIWRNSFNAIFKQTRDEDLARQGAWRNVKLQYRKEDDKWVKKTKAELAENISIIEGDIQL